MLQTAFLKQILSARRMPIVELSTPLLLLLLLVLLQRIETKRLEPNGRSLLEWGHGFS